LFPRLNRVAVFWFAYILTRPLGASFADWADVSRRRGGLGLGTGPVSAVLIVAIAALIGFLAVTRRDHQDDVTAARIGLN
jgi:uncharacterized membrane-anchored protein